MRRHKVDFAGVPDNRALVLCADDDLRSSVRYWLEDLGLGVDITSKGAQAAALLRESNYAALVTDRFLPPWPGLGGIPRLKRRHPNIRIVVILTHGPVGAASLLRIAGADAVIELPICRTNLESATMPRSYARQLG
jgi:DNA-binding NtrC family response regulator